MLGLLLNVLLELSQDIQLALFYYLQYLYLHIYLEYLNCPTELLQELLSGMLISKQYGVL